MPISRRNLVKLSIATLGAASLPNLVSADPTMKPAPTPSADSGAPSGPFTLPPLPFAYEALEPHIDAETMHLHHDKHHAAYVKKLNEAVTGAGFATEGKDIDDILKNLDAVPESIRTAVRNHGGGHSNHSLLWQTFSPKPTVPSGDFAKAIDSEMGGLDKLTAAMTKAGASVFGSGFAWLILSEGKLGIVTTPNQDSPFSEGKYPLMGIDVWEHAYYLNYLNVRADYLAAIWKVTNWDFISERYAKAITKP